MSLLSLSAASQDAVRRAPNVLVVLIDDAGYGQSGTFGGLVPTPTLDRLAERGLRYTRFHVAAMCSPTRAALLTGRNPHAVGMGAITNWSNDSPGYTASIPKSAAMVSEVLRQNGYATAAIGKWHLIPDSETTLSGPFDHWPTHQGFDYYYGFIGAEVDQWHPELTEGTAPVEMASPPGRRDDYTLNENLADKAIRWIQMEKGLTPDKPFFMYYAPGATHAPLQAPKKWIDSFRGQFDMGWDLYREIVLERQKRLGVVPQDTVLTPRPEGLPAWDSLTADQKRVYARLMEVFAGFMAQSDHEIGRVVDAIRDTGQLDNTLILYIAGDNGASFEGNLTGTTNSMAQINGVPETAGEMLARLDDLGGPHTTPFYPAGWAWAGNTPFQWGKRVGSHLGGTRDPLVISWPERIKDHGGIRAQFHNVTDIVPTVLEAASVPPPAEVNGTRQQAIDGLSMMSTFASPRAPETRTTQYFEMLGNRAIYRDGWIAAARSGVLPWVYTEKSDLDSQPWELYDLTRDYSEANDLASRNPERVKELQSLFLEEARRNNVLPLDGRVAGRQHVNPGTHFIFYPGARRLYDALAPSFVNRSMTMKAELDMPVVGGDGVLAAVGGEAGGFSFFVNERRLTFTYNYFKRTVTTVASEHRLPAGPVTAELRFDYDGGGRGKGGTVSLYVNGVPEGRGALPQTVPAAFSFEEPFDVGEDSASAVGDYQSPFPFSGTLRRLIIDLGPKESGTPKPEPSR